MATCGYCKKEFTKASNIQRFCTRKCQRDSRKTLRKRQQAQWARKNRAENIEEARAKGKLFHLKHREKRLEYSRAYYDKYKKGTDKEREARKRNVKAYNERHPDRKLAHTKLVKAVYSGKISRPSKCSRCNEKCTPQGHHPDYSKPLEVLWLCVKCHRKLHRELFLSKAIDQLQANEFKFLNN